MPIAPLSRGLFLIFYNIDISIVITTVNPLLIPGWLSQQGLSLSLLKDLTQKEPVERSAGKHGAELLKAAKERVAELGYDSDRNKIQVAQYVPTEDHFIKEAPKAMQLAGHFRKEDLGRGTGSQININPNTHSEYFAHELGHHVSDQTKVGHFVRNIRSNPKTAIALAAAGGGLGLPFLNSALQEGDDDTAAAIGIATLASAPTLIDEALATKNGLAVMEKAGQRADLGQRGRLAGAYLSYMAVPVVAGLMGNTLGNFADDYTAVYNLGEASSELPM